MKILEAFGEPVSYGGQESFVINLLDNMDRAGMSFDLLSPYYCDNFSIRDRVRGYGGEVYTLGCTFRPGGLRRPAEAPIRRFLKEHEYDVIHIHSSSNSMLAMYARLAHEAGIGKIIVHSHCTGRSDIRHKVSKAITSYSLTTYPTDYCACSREAGEWRFPENICRDQLNILYNGIDAEMFAYDENVRLTARDRLGISEQTIVVGCVGRLTWQKNQEFLLDVMRDLCNEEKNEGREYCLILLGDGEDKKMLEDKAVKLGVDGHVIFAGVTETPSVFYQLSDVLVVPSRYEGLGTVAIEGQAAGLDVLASDRLPCITGVTDAIRFIPLEDRREWVRRITSDHVRHPENSVAVAGSAFNARSTAEIVRSIYIGKRTNIG